MLQFLCPVNIWIKDSKSVALPVTSSLPDALYVVFDDFKPSIPSFPVLCSDHPAWESEGVYVDCLLQEFSAWCHGEAREDNPLAVFSPLHFSAYIDYKYMTQVFAECPHLLKEGIIICVNFIYICVCVCVHVFECVCVPVLWERELGVCCACMYL